MTAGTIATRERLWTTKTWPFIAFESFAVTTILPLVMADLGGVHWYSFAYSATLTGALVGMVIGGNWSDRGGPRRPLMVGGTLFLAGLVLCVVAPDPMTFLFGRLLQGLGGGIDSVILYILIARHFPEDSRPRMFGLLTAAWLVPSMAGPVVAGALSDLTNWRTVFGIILVGAAISLLCLLYVTRGPVSQTRVSTRDIIGRKGALSLVAALLLVTLHVGGQLGPPLSAGVVAAALIALLVTARVILPPGTLLLRGSPQRFVALRALLGATVTTTDLYLTLYLQAERGYPPTTAGIVIAVGAVGWALGAWLQGRLPSEHAFTHRLVLVATPLIATGPASVLIYTTTELPLWAVIGGCIAMGTGMGIAYPRISSATLALTDTHQHGAFSSALQAGESMSVGATTALTAVILASTFSADGAFTLIYAILVGFACFAAIIAALDRGRSCTSGNAS